MTLTLCLLDPSLSDNDGTPSDNLGDLIIADAVTRELASIPWNEAPEITRVSTHQFPGPAEMRAMREADLRVVGGSNLISGNLLRKRQWRLTVAQHVLLSDITLMGVGWWQYMPPPTLPTKLLMARLLSRKGVHSMRDAYSREQLGLLGYRNAVNTSCPTVWGLGAVADRLPVAKGTEAVFTLTDYNRDPAADAALIQTLRAAYGRVHFWPQGRHDLDYAQTLDLMGVEVIERSLEAYDDFLRGPGEIDFVGTRLHGGIRAMQQGRRALILAVDNRATEISRDTGIPVVDRRDIEGVRNWIGAETGFALHLDAGAIAAWKGQFAARGLARGPDR